MIRMLTKCVAASHLSLDDNVLRAVVPSCFAEQTLQLQFVQLQNVQQLVNQPRRFVSMCPMSFTCTIFYLYRTLCPRLPLYIWKAWRQGQIGLNMNTFSQLQYLCTIHFIQVVPAEVLEDEVEFVSYLRAFNDRYSIWLLLSLLVGIVQLVNY